MAKICKSCGEYFNGDYCDKCGYGKTDVKIKSVEKYKKFNKPERFMSDEEKQEYYEHMRHKQAEKAEKAKGKSNKNLLIFVAIVAVAVIIAGLVSSGVISKGEKTDVVKDYFQALNERDFDKFVKCFPKEIKQEYKDDRSNLNYSKDEYMEELVSDFKEEYGEGFSFEVSCGKEKLIDDYSMEAYKEAYGKVPNISETYIVAATVTVKGPDKTAEVHMECFVGKVMGRWKLFNMEEVPGTITEDTMSSAS